MQPIVWLAIIGVAITGLGMGFLAPGFDMNVQNLGAQEQDLVAPITTANIDFVISAVDGVQGQKAVIKNRITQCSFHSPNSFGQAGGQTGMYSGAIIICKLTDSVNDVVAEGKIVLTSAGYHGSTTTFIKITDVVAQDANNVQNVYDVKIVVLGADPTPP